MCRMIAIAGVPPLPLREALKAFYPLCSAGCTHKGDTPGHGDGWGMSGFSGGRAVYFARDTRPASECVAEYEQATERAVRSSPPIVLSHFRKASEGETELANTHPFHHQDWIFAHNGTVFGAVGSFTLYASQPLGSTDSERFFMWIYEQIHGEIDPTRALIELLKRARQELVYTSLSFLMSDGKRLWAYREYGDRRLEKGITVEDRANYYTMHWTSQEKSVIFCSEPLKELKGPWTPLDQRTLAICTAQVPLPQFVKIL
jgi:predicted glutamine amidotransferase